MTHVSKNRFQRLAALLILISATAGVTVTVSGASPFGAPTSADSPSATAPVSDSRATPTEKKLGVPPDAPPATETPRQAFNVLTRTASTADRLPRDAVPGTNGAVIDPTAARRAYSGALGRVFIVPGDQETCVSTLDAHGRDSGATDSCVPTCVPTGLAQRRGAFTVTQCSDAVHPQRRFIAGVAPDGVSSIAFQRGGVTHEKATVTSNGFAAEVDQPIDTIVLDNGTTTTLPPVTC